MILILNMNEYINNQCTFSFDLFLINLYITSSSSFSTSKLKLHIFFDKNPLYGFSFYNSFLRQIEYLTYYHIVS